MSTRVAINDLVDVPTLGHYLKYDPVHGCFNQEIEPGTDGFFINGKETKVFRQSSLGTLQWHELDVDIVIASSGRYTDRVHSEKHL